MLVAVMALIAVSCGGGTEGAEDPGTTQPDGGTVTTEGLDAPGTTTGPETTTTEATGSSGAAAGWLTVDGETFEFTDVYECEIGEDGGSPDYRGFGGRTADGSADLQIAFFPPDDDFSSLTGLTLDRDVDGEEWTYATIYTGTQGEMSVEVAADGASGIADVGVVGLGNPYGGDFISTEWGFSCG